MLVLFAINFVEDDAIMLGCNTHFCWCGASNSVKYEHHSHKLGGLDLVLSCQLPLMAFSQQLSTRLI